MPTLRLVHCGGTCAYKTLSTDGNATVNPAWCDPSPDACALALLHIHPQITFLLCGLGWPATHVFDAAALAPLKR